MHQNKTNIDTEHIINSNHPIKEKLTLLVNKMQQLSESDFISNSIEVFFTIRLFLEKSPKTQCLYDSEQDLRMQEAKRFHSIIEKKFQKSGSPENVIMVSDSLGLPRLTKAWEANIIQTTTNLFNEMMPHRFKMRTWAQRYLTTSKILSNWNLITGDINGKHLIIHLGINDSADRIFLEKQRLALDAYDLTIKNKIINFGKEYRKEIMENQNNHAYTKLDLFKENLKELIFHAENSNAKSITFINIITFPDNHKIKTPINRIKYNQAFNDIKLKNQHINIIDLNAKVLNSGFEKCMLEDYIHLSNYGHKILANEILDTLEKN